MSALRPHRVFGFRLLPAVLLAVVSTGTASNANAAEPAHLQAAIDLLKVVQPTDTDYQHKSGTVVWPGDPSGAKSECRTDCSGFIDALLKRSYGLNAAQFEKWFNTKRPVARDYHDVIAAGRGLQAIATLNQVRPGDLIAIKYPKDSANTGHMLLVASTPKQRPATAPVVEGTQQWEVTVIDVSESGHGPTDTRHKPDGTFSDGLGRGLFRIYTDANGTVVGHSWSETKGSKFVAQSDRHLLIGRVSSDFIGELKNPKK